MKPFLKYLFFLIGGVICISLLVFSIYTDLAHLNGYTPAPIEKWKAYRHARQHHELIYFCLILYTMIHIVSLLSIINVKKGLVQLTEQALLSIKLIVRMTFAFTIWTMMFMTVVAISAVTTLTMATTIVISIIILIVIVTTVVATAAATTTVVIIVVVPTASTTSTSTTKEIPTTHICFTSFDCLKAYLVNLSWLYFY